jgi:predicted DNA-binding transcriptional regulator AlpA
MTLQEAERRRRQSERDRANPDDNRVLSFRQWCELNGFSLSTGYRILAGESGPVVTQLSARRIGITVGNNARWLASRARGAA